MTAPGFPPPDPNDRQVWAQTPLSGTLDHGYAPWVYKVGIGDLDFEFPAATEEDAVMRWYKASVRP